MTHPENTTPANPAQGVSEALSDCLDMLARFTHSTSNNLKHVEARAVYRAGRAALTAAIGAGGQAEDSCLSPAPVQEAVAKVRRVERQPPVSAQESTQ